MFKHGNRKSHGLLRVRILSHRKNSFESLRELDRNLLRDIGIGRGEILRASRIISRLGKRHINSDQ